jgi:signal transduction histidine kinase
MAWLADVGEIAGPLAHEINNLLNSLLLHLAVLERDVSEDLRGDLKEIRSQGTTMAATIRRFQAYRNNLKPAESAVDLNAVITGAAQRLSADPSSISIALDANAPLVRARPGDLERLCTFLLRNALMAAGTGTVGVRTEASAHKIVMQVEDSGPGIPLDLLERAFEPSIVTRERVNPLEMAGCRAVTTRLGGVIRAINRPAGVAVVVELPIDTAP